MRSGVLILVNDKILSLRDLTLVNFEGRQIEVLTIYDFYSYALRHLFSYPLIHYLTLVYEKCRQLNCFLRALSRYCQSILDTRQRWQFLTKVLRYYAWVEVFRLRICSRVRALWCNNTTQLDRVPLHLLWNKLLMIVVARGSIRDVSTSVNSWVT
jgi:hypothetical protein